MGTRNVFAGLAAGAVLALAGAALGAAADNPVLRIMPLGDSITHGSQSERGNGYRAPLYVALTNLGYNVDYVGTQTDNYGKTDPFLADSDHEGHSSWKISNATMGIFENIQSFFAQIDDPHVILLHIGTNDLGDGNETFRSQATNRLVRLLDRIHECQPSAKVVVTTLMRRWTSAANEAETDNWRYAAITNAFNPAVPGIVAAQQAKGQDAYFLDMHAAVPTFEQIADLVHPNDVGYTNMANAWVSAVTALVPDPANFAVENDLAVVQTTTDAVGDDAFAVNFTFNQKVTAATATDAANWTVAGTDAVPSITLSADQRTATLTFPAGEYYTPVTVTAKQGGVRNATGGKTLHAARAMTVPGVFPQGAWRYVPAEEFNQYRLVYDLDMPTKGNFAQKPVPYTVDDAGKIGAFSRVAYYMELQKSGEPMQYVWVSMDAFTNDAARVGVPVGWQFLKNVTNLRVWSNVPNIRTNQTIAVGNIEFWPMSFSGTVKRGLDGALDVYDFDDTPTNGDYGSMQVHDTDMLTNSCIFTYNRFQKDDAGEMGIGPHFNTSNSGWDWTQTYNAAQYSLRHLQVYVLPEASAAAAPEVVSTTTALAADGTVVVDVKFSVDVLRDGLGGAFTVSSGYVTSVERDGVDFSLVHVHVTGVTSDNFNLTVDGARVKAAANGATPMASGATFALARPLPAGIAEHVPAELRAGYVPIYSVNVPVTKGVNWRNGVPYYLNAAQDVAGGVERVAYYFEQVRVDGTGTNFVWTSFDAWTDDCTKYGVPVNDSLGFGQKWVTNQDVYSNVGGVVNGTGMDGGFLEFWPHNYGGANNNNIPYAGSTCDWGDGLTGGATTWHACMQVHNVTNQQTVFGISNFNGSNVNEPVGAGIGNNTQYRANRSSTGTINPDWTQAYGNTDNFSSMKLHVLVRTKSDVPAYVAANVPQAKDYTLLYQIDIPARFYVHDPAQYKAAHTIDNRARYAGAHVARVGYYFELTTTNDNPTTTWCWAAFDGFTDNLASYSFTTNVTIKRFVSNLDVASNASDVKAGHYPDGNIEFFYTDFGKTANLDIGANSSNYDWDDTPSSTSAGFSCLQIHNYREQQTLIAISRLRHSSGYSDVGIGNCSVSGNKDWTQQQTAGKYAVRRLYVFVSFDNTPSSFLHAVPSLDRTKVCAQFVDNVPSQLVDPSAWTFTAGNATVATAARSPSDPREVVLTLAEPLAASSSYTLQCAYTAGGEAKTASASFTTVADDPRPAFLTAEAVPEASDYALVNLLKVPSAAFNYTWTCAPYAVDESRFGDVAFDRVAYLLHLVGNNGVEQWAWASMDAFTDDLSKIGLPTAQRMNDFQQYVTNLSVRAWRSDNNLYVTPGDFSDGNIEFFWHDFSQSNRKEILNASGSVYDWGDACSFYSKPGYGCLQVHNYRKSEVVLSVSRTGASAGPTTVRVGSLGIGNGSRQGVTDDDWTTAGNAASFTTRDLYVFVRPAVTSKGDGPTFTVQPQPATVGIGKPHALHAFAPEAVRYQWFKGMTPIPGATSAWLDVDTGMPGRARYSVIAYADDANYTVSETATVRVAGRDTMLIVR